MTSNFGRSISKRDAELEKLTTYCLRLSVIYAPSNGRGCLYGIEAQRYAVMVGHQASIWISIAIPWFAALMALSMRLWARRLTKMTWWLDDYFAILAFVSPCRHLLLLGSRQTDILQIFATGYCGIMIECKNTTLDRWEFNHSLYVSGTLHTYLGAMIPDSTADDEKEAILEQSRFLSLFNSLCYATSIACSKAAVLFLYWRLFKLSSIRRPIWILLGIVVAWFLLRTFMLIFRCVPVQSLWDYSITDKRCNIDGDKFFLGTITTHFILDLIILALPLFEVFHLRMKLGQKMAVAGLFLVGTM